MKQFKKSREPTSFKTNVSIKTFNKVSLIKRSQIVSIHNYNETDIMSVYRFTIFRLQQNEKWNFFLDI